MQRVIGKKDNFKNKRWFPQYMQSAPLESTFEEPTLGLCSKSRASLRMDKVSTTLKDILVTKLLLDAATVKFAEAVHKNPAAYLDQFQTARLVHITNYFHLSDLDDHPNEWRLHLDGVVRHKVEQKDPMAIVAVYSLVPRYQVSTHAIFPKEFEKFRVFYIQVPS